jgi:hypothetical protein
MKPTVKILLIGMVILAIVIGVGVLLAGSVLGKAVTSGVNTIGPKVTGTEVTLAEAYVSPLFGKGSMSGLVIGNPIGWSDRKLAKLGHISIDIQPMSLLGDTWVVEEVIIEAPEFSYETKIVSSNVKELLQQIESAVGTSEDPNATENESAPAEETVRRWSVKRFVMTDGKVTVGAGASAVTVPLPALELNDLGSPENGLTSRELALAVSKEVTGDIIVAAAGALKTMSGTSGASAAEGIKNVGESIKGLFGSGKDEG